MNQSDRALLLTLYQHVLDQSETQVMTIKIFSAWMGNVESRLAWRRSIEASPDPAARTELSAIEERHQKEMASVVAQLKDFLAQAESQHEKCEAALSAWKRLSGDV